MQIAHSSVSAQQQHPIKRFGKRYASVSEGTQGKPSQRAAGLKADKKMWVIEAAPVMSVHPP
jgi:hypothetical protein